MFEYSGFDTTECGDQDMIVLFFTKNKTDSKEINDFIESIPNIKLCDILKLVDKNIIINEIQSNVDSCPENIDLNELMFEVEYDKTEITILLMYIF